MHLSVAPSLDGVARVAAIANSIVHKRMARGRLVPSLLLLLGALGPWMVRAAAGIVVVAPFHRRGVRVRAVPIDGDHWLGRPGGHSAAP
jgi:hypothetical protein